MSSSIIRKNNVDQLIKMVNKKEEIDEETYKNEEEEEDQCGSDGEVGNSKSSSDEDDLSFKD